MELSMNRIENEKSESGVVTAVAMAVSGVCVCLSLVAENGGDY